MGKVSVKAYLGLVAGAISPQKKAENALDHFNTLIWPENLPSSLLSPSSSLRPVFFECVYPAVPQHTSFMYTIILHHPRFTISVSGSHKHYNQSIPATHHTASLDSCSNLLS
jgi:hypothetical protein